MMRVLSQPRDGNLLTELSAAIADADYARYFELRILVAYAKLSGVHQLLPHVNSFQAAGGHVEVIVGIGQKNTSKEAVEALVDAGASVSIFHSPGSLQRTFHPKAFLLRGHQSGWSSVGSSNLTRGGLDTNYEWNTITRFDLANGHEAAAFQSLQKIFTDLLPGANPSSRPATATLIHALHQRGALPSESQLQKESIKAAQQEKADRLSELFGKEKLPEPVSKAAKAPKLVAKKATPAKKAAAGMMQAATTPPQGFWKRLSAGDVSKTSSPGQIIIPKAGWPFFPALGEPEIKPSGAAQADSYFDVVFDDGLGNTTYVANARRIHYPPARGHARQNQESRFTFRHRQGVFDTLEEGDVLVFRRTPSAGAWFEVTRVPKKVAATKYQDDHGVL